MKMLCMGLIVEEVYSSFSYLFDFFFLIRVLIIMLKRIPKQQFEINKFLIKDFVVQGYFFLLFNHLQWVLVLGD